MLISWKWKVRKHRRFYTWDSKVQPHTRAHTRTFVHTLVGTCTHTFGMQPTQSSSSQRGGGFSLSFSSQQSGALERSVEWWPQMHPASACYGNIMGVGWEFRRGCPEFTFILMLHCSGGEKHSLSSAALMCSSSNCCTFSPGTFWFALKRSGCHGGLQETTSA